VLAWSSVIPYRLGWATGPCNLTPASGADDLTELLTDQNNKIVGLHAELVDKARADLGPAVSGRLSPVRSPEPVGMAGGVSCSAWCRCTAGRPERHMAQPRWVAALPARTDSPLHWLFPAPA
jgi:hypothetical protein